MAARTSLMPNNGIGIGHLPQRAPFMALLAAARLARARAQASRNPRLLVQTVARRRLGAVRTVETQSSPKFGDLGTKGRYLRSQRSYQFLDFGGKRHLAFDSDSRLFVFPISPSKTHFTKLWLFGLTPAWELPKPFVSHAKRKGRSTPKRLKNGAGPSLESLSSDAAEPDRQSGRGVDGRPPATVRKAFISQNSEA